MTLSDRELTDDALNALDDKCDLLSGNYSVHSESYLRLRALRKEISDIKDKLLFEELVQ